MTLVLAVVASTASKYGLPLLSERFLALFEIVAARGAVDCELGHSLYLRIAERKSVADQRGT
jgi:hypothetical protein